MASKKPHAGAHLETPDGGLTAAPFEQLMERLDEIVEKLESNELGLEESIVAYERGVELAREGHARLLAAERRIEELTRRGELRPVEKEESAK